MVDNKGEPTRIKIGDREYVYQELFDKKSDGRVRFYSVDGGFITEFPSVDEMEEYIGRYAPSVINYEIDMLLRFRKKCELMIDKGYYYEKGGVEESEKGKNIADFIKRLNMLMGDMNSYQFGKVVGLNPGTIYNLAHGNRSPGIHLVKRIAEKCDVPIDWLLGG